MLMHMKYVCAYVYVFVCTCIMHIYHTYQYDMSPVFPGYVLKIPFSLLIRTSESHTAPCCLGYFIVRWGWEEALFSLEGGVHMFTGNAQHTQRLGM